MMHSSMGYDNLMLSLRKVGVFYWRRTGFFRKMRFWALKDVSLDLRRGETLGIIGRNGAGKSTLLSLLAGIISPDKGHIIRNSGRVSLLSLQAGFTAYLTGRENAIFNGMLLGLHRREIESRMDEIIAFSELEDFIDEPIRTYSAGMKARLGFAAAFQADPEILLVDEVIGVGDAAFQKKSIAAMKERLRSNRTVVIVSHNALLIQEVCDRVVWIESGVTQEQGNPERVLEKYNGFVRKHHMVANSRT